MAHIFCSSSNQEVVSISPTLNLGLTFWLALPNRDISKCIAREDLEKVHVLGLTLFSGAGNVELPYEEAWASLLEKERPHRDKAQTSQLGPKHVNEAIQLDHSAPAELTQT